MVNHHPDVTKFARENINLKAELKKLREAAAARSGGVASKEDHTSRELGRMHKYTLQLERQLRHFLGRNSEKNFLSFFGRSVVALYFYTHDCISHKISVMLIFFR